MKQNFGLSPLGGGAGLRHQHFSSIIKNKPAFKWFEVISEDFMDVGGWSKECLQEIRKHYPVIAHGVGMSIGSTDPLDMEYLETLRRFIDEINSPWVSDHLCFTMVDHSNLEDLMPLPFTQEAVNHIVERIKIVQDKLARPFLLENVTRYVTVSDREMPENEFLTKILEGANCGLLLDVTNVYLNSQFHKYDALAFIKSLPTWRIGQMHLAGWVPADDGSIVDSHDAPVPPEVWDLFKETIKVTGPSSVVVEWDQELPEVDALLKETQIADTIIFSNIHKAA